MAMSETIQICKDAAQETGTDKSLWISTFCIDSGESSSADYNATSVDTEAKTGRKPEC